VVSTRLSVDERRAQLVEAAIGLAEKSGVAGVTTRDVARAAGVSLGVVHYCFENKDALMIALVKALSDELRDPVEADEQLWQSAGTGVHALRNLLRACLAVMWLNVEAGRSRQQLTYEVTVYALREGARTPPKLAIARDQYVFQDANVAIIIEHARVGTSTKWTVPVETLSRFILASIDGIVLRWLLDDDSAAAREALDLVATAVSGYATE
jgi:AcrR family transcriptional regulator